MAAADQLKRKAGEQQEAEKQLEDSVNKADDVEGISSISWDRTCAGKAKEVADLRQQQHMRHDMVASGTTLRGELDALLAAGPEATRLKAMKELSCLPCADCGLT